MQYIDFRFPGQNIFWILFYILIQTKKFNPQLELPIDLLIIP